MTGDPTTADELLTQARRKLRRLTPRETYARMADGLRLVDIRSDAQREADGLIPGAVYVPRNVLEWRLDPACRHREPALGRADARVALICDEGYQSSLAAATIARFGLAEVTDVVGGFRAWRAAGLPVEPVQDQGAVISAAEAYDRHVGRYGAQLASGLADVAGVRRGQRALDVGCGPGPMTAVLADRLGASNVAAIDPSEPFVEACRARVPGADVRVGVGERLPFAAGEFDVVLAQLVVQLMDDRVAGVREMARVARPGAVVAACVWDSSTMPLLRSFWDAALAVAPERAGELDEGQRVGYPRPEELGELLDAGGLIHVTTGEVVVSAAYESFDDLFRPFAAGVGHSGACFSALDDEAQPRVRADARRRLDVEDGPFVLMARAWWARGIAPGA